MFHGDDELSFTAREVERIARAEGRAPGRERQARLALPHHEGGGGRLLGAVLAGVLIVVLIGALGRVSDANSNAAVASEAARTAAPRASAPQIDRGPQANQPENSPTLSPTNIRPQDPREPAPPQNLLPVGWDRAGYTLDTVLYANPRPGAAAVGPIPAGTELLVRIPPTAGFCTNAFPPQEMRRYEWHAAILASGRAWGYVCVAFSDSFNEEIRHELPPGWIRSVYQGEAPALLQYPNGQILPGTEVIMRASGSSPDEFFVMSADGLSWGFGLFQIDTSPSDAPPADGIKEVGRRVALPPDWERVTLSFETPLYVSTQPGAALVAWLPVGTVILSKHLFDSWYAVVTENGELSGSMVYAMSPHEPVRVTFGDWSYEHFPDGKPALVRRLSNGSIFYIFADGNGWGGTSPKVL